MFGGVMLILFFIWTIITIVGLVISKNLIVFLQSAGFIIIALGYIAILSSYYILKRFFRDEYEYY